MTEVTFQRKAPAPAVFADDQLRMRGVPALHSPITTSQHTEIKPRATVYNMNRKGSTMTAPTNRLNTQPPPATAGRTSAAPRMRPRGAQPLPDGRPNKRPRPSRPGAVAQAPEQIAEPVQVVQAQPAVSIAQIIPPANALLVGQLLEMFIVNETYSGRGNASTTLLAKQTLVDIHPLLPPGVVIPVPQIEPAPMPPVQAAAPTTPAAPASEKAPEGGASQH